MDPLHNTPVFSVSELNTTCRALLESSFPRIWVEGEISNFITPGSGHFYFSLKDTQAQVRCAMFRLYNKTLKAPPEDGMQVKLLAKVSLYPNRGDFQLIVEKLEAYGEGLLKKAYEKLVSKLAQQGLFQKKYKKKIPTLPKHIGIITSPTGAAIRDILNVLKRRFSQIPVTLYPTLVQGEQAAPQIIQALKVAQKHKRADVLILARGGGSLEDLWAFNDPTLAREIFECTIPIVSGVGHETDTTLCDLVADLRAPTPSAASELVTPDGKYLRQRLYQATQQLTEKMTAILQNLAQQLDDLSNNQLPDLMKDTLTQSRFCFETLSNTLNALSPLATLSRGYAIVNTSSHSKKQKVLFRAKDTGIGEQLSIQLSEGRLDCTVRELLDDC